MGREVRRVPMDWQHPVDEDGQYIPLFEGTYTQRCREWDEGYAQWQRGLKKDVHGGWTPKDADEQTLSFAEWDGERPQAEDYMPEWPAEQCVGWQMYETTTEGTPISPVMDSPEALAHWLADHHASAFSGMTATYQEWLVMIRAGSAISLVMTDTGIYSGVSAIGNLPPKHEG